MPEIDLAVTQHALFPVVALQALDHRRQFRSSRQRELVAEQVEPPPDLRQPFLPTLARYQAEREQRWNEESVDQVVLVEVESEPLFFAHDQHLVAAAADQLDQTVGSQKRQAFAEAADVALERGGRRDPLKLDQSGQRVRLRGILFVQLPAMRSREHDRRRNRGSAGYRTPVDLAQDTETE